LKKKAGTIIRDDISTRASLSVDVNGERSLFQVIMTQAGEWDYVTLKPLVSSFFPESIADLETSEQNRQMLLKIAGAPEGMVFFSSTDEDERTRLMGVCLMECNGLGRESMVIGEGLRFLGDGMSVLPVRRGDENMGVWIRAACEHEPDIVAVEDLPLDASVLTAAYNCTLRGKLLFGGVHAPGVRATLRKLCCLRERFPMFLTNLRGIAACRSVRILCTACTGKGCTACNNTGYSGKRYLVETVLFDDEMLEVLRRSAAGAEVMDFLAERGFRGIHDVAADMLRAGEITEDEYNMATIDNGRLIWP
jgi:general secretion pathway protein E